MSIDPKHDEKLEVSERVSGSDFNEKWLTEVVRRHKAAPEPFRKNGYTLVRASVRSGRIAIPGHALTPAEARAMGEALIAHARYIREQEDPICGRLLVDQVVNTWDPPICKRPKGHPGVCSDNDDEGGGA